MMQPLTLAQWLSAPRPPQTLIAWQEAHSWTLAHLRYDVAHLLNNLQQQPGERWAFCFDNSYLFLVALLATLHAGKTPVLPGHSRAALLHEQRALFDGILSDKPLPWRGPLRVIQSAMATASHEYAFPAIGDNACIELFTSGSTGEPKRISKPVKSLDREAALIAAHYAGRLTGSRVVASVAPQHLYGLTFRLFLPMALGLPLHAAMIEYAEQLAALSHDHHYLFISSPAFLKRLDYRLTPPPVAMILSAGGKLPWQDAMHTGSIAGRMKSTAARKAGLSPAASACRIMRRGSRSQASAFSRRATQFVYFRRLSPTITAWLSMIFCISMKAVNSSWQVVATG